MDLAMLIQGLPVRVARGEPAGVRVRDITEDSRTVVPGSLFLARPGLCDDGRAHAAEAVRDGAVAVLTDQTSDADANAVVLHCDDVPLIGAQLAERFWGGPSGRLALVGVTGTNGKTSVAHACAHMLGHAGVKTGLIGTVQIDDGRERTPACMTTPPAVELSRTLASMVANGCRACVMEVSSHALDQRRVAALAFDVAVFTNLSGDHLDYHKTIEAYAGAKRRLFDGLGPGAVRIGNADDKWNGRIAGAGAVLCAHEPGGGPWRVAVTSHTLGGLGVRLGGPEYAIEGVAPLIGAHNAMNLLQAACAADTVLTQTGLAGDARRDALAGAIGSCKAPPGRLERVSTEQDDIHVFVDFAHTDDALGKMLAGVRSLVPDGAQLWVVFGCGGLKDRTKRPRMGRVAGALADRVVLTSDNPRTQDPMEIIDDTIGGIDTERRGGVPCEPDRERAIAMAIREAKPGDVVVLAGKGHETVQELPDGRGGVVVRPFDDRLVARSSLDERAGIVRTKAAMP